MSERKRHSRADLDVLRKKTRPEILEIFGSFEDRGQDDESFIKKATTLIDPDRVPGLSNAASYGDAERIGQTVLAACRRPLEQASDPSPTDVTEADKVLQNRFTFYGEEHTLPDDFDWDENPGTRHWGMDLNRFSFLSPLTNACLQTGDVRYGRKAIDLILDWIAKCEIERCFIATPYVFGSYLNNTIHCGAWARCITRLIPTDIVKPVELLRVLKSIHEQLGYLEVVTNGHAGNWPTIGCQGALASMAALHVLRDQDRFTSYYIETLGNQVEEQILPDGVQDELTPHYHSVVVNNILTCAESCASLGLSLKQRTLNTLRRMLRYQEQTVTPGRTAHVAFNDSDPDSVPNVADRLDRLGMRDYLPEPDSLGPEAYPYAGVGFLRQRASEGDLYLAFDGGPFGRSHQHEDKLGFWLHAYGRDLIVDPGRHLYDVSEVSFLPYLKSTEAHSTIRVDGKDQNSRAHSDTWIASAPGSLTFSESSEEVRASAQYDLGYGPSNEIDVTHRREVVFVDNRFWVLFDTVTGDGSHNLESRFQFAPGDIQLEGDRTTTCHDDANLLLVTTGAWNEIRVLKGEENPRAGWYSASYNKIEPAPMLSLTIDTDLPWHCAVLLLPYTGTNPPDAAVAYAEGTATVSLGSEAFTVTST
ncbi:TPA: hypothetical protein DCE37_03215 [Candidatus Latescibacteria bacterium]|nr:hypothetical protein [Candidatus Latescibacterota bacterium]